MEEIGSLAPGLLIALFFIGFIGLVIIFRFIPVGLWVQAITSGVRVSFLTLFGMRFRKVNPSDIVLPLINAHKAGLEQVTLNELESHFLSGGNVSRVVNALISADKAGIPLPFKQAAAIDLAGRDVFEAVQVSVNPKVITTPKVAAMAKNGIQLLAASPLRCRTTRPITGRGTCTTPSRGLTGWEIGRASCRERV